MRRSRFPVIRNPRLDEIKGNPDDPFYKKEHPLHQARVTEVNQLLSMLAKVEK